MRYEATTGKKVGYVFSIIFNGVMIYIFRNVLNWNLGFFDPAFANIVWAFNLSLSASIFANFVFMFFDVAWFHHLMQAILNVFSWISIYFAYNVFPFNLPGDLWNNILRYSLLFLLIVIPLATLVEVIQFLRKLIRSDNKQE